MKTYPLSDPTFWDRIMKDIGAVPGIYRLHYQRVPGQFDVIPRLLGSDEKGTLYIGTSVNLPYRTGNLKKSVCAAYGVLGYKDPGTHQCGKKIVQSLKFRQRFPFEGLCLSVQACRPEDEEVGYREGDHTKLEWRFLSEYFSEFGEFPPLNG